MDRTEELIESSKQLQERIRESYKELGIDTWFLDLWGEDFEKVFTERYVAHKVYRFYFSRNNRRISKDDAYYIARAIKTDFEIACRRIAKNQKKSLFKIAHNPVLKRIIERYEQQVSDQTGTELNGRGQSYAFRLIDSYCATSEALARSSSESDKQEMETHQRQIRTESSRSSTT